MADVAALTVSILGTQTVTPAANAAASSLAALEGAAGRVGSSMVSMAANAAKATAAIAALGAGAATAGFASAVKVAADFESQLSAIAAVSGATAEQMGRINAVALQLGKDTSFSAREAAAGMEEIIKAGVSLEDTLNGAARAALDLAAASGTEVSEAAAIMSNAMNTFKIAGTDAAHVADVFTQAANASATDVHQLGYAMASTSAVAATLGVSFEDTATALAVMAQNGIKGSDAGTSLKTMLLNLTPSTKAQVAAAKELGIITADGANQFYTAEGRAKSMAEIAGVLQTATKNLTQEQKIQALQTIFGADAIRAAAIMANAGAEGFTNMAGAMNAAGSAQQAANTRLDNLKGALERLGGTWETIQIKFAQPFLPVLTRGVQTLEKALNAAEPSITRFAERAAAGLDTLITRATAATPRFVALGAGLLAFGRQGLALAQDVLPKLTAQVRAFADGFSLGGVGQGASSLVGGLIGSFRQIEPVLMTVGRALVTNITSTFEFLTTRVLPPLVSMVEQIGAVLERTLLPAFLQTGQVMRGIFGDTLDWLARTVMPPFLSVIEQTSNFWTQTMLPTLPAVATALRTTLGETVQWLATDVWPRLRTAADVAWSFISGTIIPAIPGLARQIRDVLGVAIQWVADTGWPALVSAGETVTSWITGVAIPAFEQFTAFLGQTLPPVISWITDTGWPAITSAGQAVTEWITGTAIPAFTQLADWLGPKIQVAADWIINTGWPALVAAGTLVTEWITGTAIPALTQLADWLGPKIQAATEWVMSTGWPGLVTAGQAFSEWVTGIAIPALTQLADWLGPKLQEAMTWLSGTGFPAAVTAAQQLNAAWTATVDWANQLWAKLAEKGVFTDLAAAFNELWTAGQVLVETFWPQMKEGADQAFTATDVFVALIKGASQFLLAFATGVNTIAQAMRDLKAAAESMPAWMIEVIRRGSTAMPGLPSVVSPFLPSAPAGQQQNQSQSTPYGESSGFTTSPLANQPRWTEAQVRQLQDRILTEMPKPPAYNANASLAERMKQWAPTLQWLEANTGFKAENLAGLLAAENNFGDSPLSSQGNNYFSVTRSPYDRYALPGDSRFPSYPNPESNIARALGLILHPENTNYNAAAAARGGSPQDLSAALAAGGWIVNEPGFPVSTWQTNVASGANYWANIVGQTPAVQRMGSNGPPSNPTASLASLRAVNQFDMGLTWADAEAACGPAALMTFWAATGRTPDAQEAMTLARASGWTRGGGMNGVGNFMAMLGRAGINAALDTTPSEAEIQQSLAAGHPVALSTPGHYFAATAYDPATGKYNVGGSGAALRQGSEWMSLDQMQALMGPLNGVVTLLDSVAPAANGAAQAFNVFTGATDAAVEPTNQFGTAITATEAVAATLPDTMTAAAEGTVAATQAIADGTATTAETVQATFDVMREGALTSVTDLGTGVLTTVQDMSGNTIATVTDMAGQVTTQSATLASGVSLNMADMGVQTTTSVNAMAGTITTTMTDLAGNAVTTVTNMSGQVVAQYVSMQTTAGSSVAQLASQSQESFSQIVSSAETVQGAADSVNEALSSIEPPDPGPVVDAFAEMADAAEDAAKAAKKAAEAIKDITQAEKGGSKGEGKGKNPFAKKAAGGWTQGLTLVGEEGPELISPQRPMYVTNASDTRGMLGGGSVQISVGSIVIQGSDKDAAELAEEIRAELIKTARRNGGTTTLFG